MKVPSYLYATQCGWSALPREALPQWSTKRKSKRGRALTRLRIWPLSFAQINSAEASGWSGALYRNREEPILSDGGDFRSQIESDVTSQNGICLDS